LEAYMNRWSTGIGLYLLLAVVLAGMMLLDG
jgi:hypothetical protein